MATMVPALRGKFGETEYFLSSMRVGEFLKFACFPKEISDWEDFSIEERYHKDINLANVRKSVAPYFAMDEYRFSGSLVLAVINHENMVFEPLTSFGGRSNVPALYQTASGDMGFLTLQGGETLVPLDGQHRTKAFKFAIDGADDNNRTIPGMKSNPDLSNDQVSVILVRFEPTRARRIFNKINRYAKPTSKADNLITDDDDAMAVMTRSLISEKNGVISSRMVRIGANTLNKKAPEFTTLSTFYDATIAIVEGLGYAGKGLLSSMEEDQRELVKEDVEPIWETLLSNIDLWRKALEDTSEGGGDEVRAEIRDETLLGKPIGQLSLVRAFMLMRERCEGVPMEELCARLNAIDWDVGNEMWHSVLMNPNGRVMSGKNTVNRATQFIAHLGGASLSDEEIEALLDHIYGEDWESHELPAPVA